MAPNTFVLPIRYRSGELIAHGGMADVYRATDTALERVVAVKVLADRFADDEEVRIRFTREALTAARLAGAPNVVTIFDVGENGGRPYIVMEFLPGGTLADRIRRGRVEPAQALAWLEQAGRALDAAHALGIVHRDVKLANLMIAGDGEVRVTDFGIARAAGHHTMTVAGTVLGTTGYMSPEQATGQRSSPASDRYALAVVAFELLAGRRPFVAETPSAEAAAHAIAAVPPATGFNRDLPAALDPALARGLAKDPSHRPDSCGELVDSLRLAFHDGAGTTLHAAPLAPVVPIASSGPARRSRARRRSALLLAALAAAAAGVGVAFVVSGDGGGDGVRTVVRTQTREGRVQVRTVTVESTRTVQAPAATPSAGGQESVVPEGEGHENGGEGTDGGGVAGGASLNDRGYRLLRSGDAEGALPLLERAVQVLQGTSSRAEAYASYNLALARYSLGRCDGVLELLDRSREVQGDRREISRLRKQARKTCDD